MIKVVGIIAEYNPFHNGHAFQIQKAKQITGADIVIVVMSGNFVQRGEPAIMDKWTRAHIALCCGADIVIELPVIYATASAEYFAHASVKLLHDMGIVTDICFGSESGDITALSQTAEILLQESDTFRALLKQHLQQGLSYAAARDYAFSQLYPQNKQILSQPNNILAVEYIKALLKLKSPIRPHTITRKGSYHDTALQHNTIASASAIRNALKNHNEKQIYDYIPCAEIVQKSLLVQKCPVFLNFFSSALQYAIRTQSPEQIKNIFEVTEGLENRIYKAIESNYDIENIISFVKTKRYTQTQIQRIFIHILLQIQKKEVLYYNQTGYCPYIRVLGFRREKQFVLSLLKKHAVLPLVTNLKKELKKEFLNERAQRLLQMEIKATNIYVMAIPNETYHALGQDFTQPMVMISSPET